MASRITKLLSDGTCVISIECDACGKKAEGVITQIGWDIYTVIGLPHIGLQELDKAMQSWVQSGKCSDCEWEEMLHGE